MMTLWHIARELWHIVYVPGAVILLFGAAVFVHEFGHFWVARRRGMKVEAFAIGFGPKIIGWQKDGIDYSWRWIPAGGFVKLPQMITAEALEGGSAEGPERIPPAPPWSKILVAFAGPFMNVVFGFAIATLIYFVGLPVLVNPSIIGEVDPKSPEAAMGIREGDRIVVVNGHPVKSWQDVTFETATARTNVIPVVIERAGERTTYRLTAKVLPEVGLKWLNLDPREHPVVGSVESGMPAAAAGLQPGDKVVSVNAIPVPSRESMIELISKSEGKPCAIVLNRRGQKVSVTMTPRYDPQTKRARIGIVFSEGVYEIQRPGPLPWERISDVLDKTFGVITALVHTKETGVRARDLSGPVGIFAQLAVWVNTDYRLALDFLVLLNINLAVLNLLPIPVLDGGHI
ncbi:MAG: RIP metalloprotease RseP, partial [Verrucomicrobia bacterium]|nr:RIP metalloprotease RseP [Verrucomicrobiota bacterium]